MAEYSAIYETAIDRIQSSFATCSVAEQKLMLQILKEMGKAGYSYTLEQVWLTDYKEIPVGIDQFLNDPYYLGQTNNEGENIYPFWRTTMNDIFNHGNKYTEIILSGATRIGKSSTAVTLMAYMLYKLMLYRDPHRYFNKKAISKFTLGFANLTKELAFSVAYREFNDTLKEVPWFMDRGKVTRSDRNFYYLPEGDKIEIIAASDGAQLLGKQVWCLKGDTKLLTTDGIKTIEECAGSTQSIIQYVDGQFIPTDADVICTKQVCDLIRVELEDGSIIEGTPDHKVMLTDGTYKPLGELTSSDDLLTFNMDKEVDDMNLKNPNATFSVYEHISPNGKRYVGITCKEPKDRWLSGGKGYRDNAHFWNAIVKYGWDNFQHNILATGLPLDEACKLEEELIAEYDLMNPDNGYNHTTGGNWSTPDQETRQKLSKALRARGPECSKKISDALKGHRVSEETKKKISESTKGRKISEKERERRKNYRHSPETLDKMRKQVPWSKGLTKDTDPRLKSMSERMQGRQLTEEWRSHLSCARKAQYVNGYSPRWINNGEIETSIQESDPLPDGFVYGRLNRDAVYIHKGEISKKIPRADLDSYLGDGWEIGRPDSVKQSIRKSLQTLHWEYDGHRFERACDLATYLHSHGYPDIVDSTITSLYNKGFGRSPKYRSLEGKIKKVVHEDKIN